MATYLAKPIRRAVLIADREYVVSIYPADDVFRFPRIEFREKRARKVRYWLPLESARNHAATKFAEIAKRERDKLKKARRQARKEGLL